LLRVGALTFAHANVTVPPALTLDGPAESETGGGGGAWTVREVAAVCVSAPLVPVIVSVYVPAGVPAGAVTVSVEVGLPAPPTDSGLKPPVAPAGRPVTLRPTLLEKPFCGESVTV
jgi:hypothetical protein